MERTLRTSRSPARTADPNTPRCRNQHSSRWISSLSEWRVAPQQEAQTWAEWLQRSKLSAGDLMGILPPMIDDVKLFDVVCGAIASVSTVIAGRVSNDCASVVCGYLIDVGQLWVTPVLCSRCPETSGDRVDIFVTDCCTVWAHTTLHCRLDAAYRADDYWILSVGEGTEVTLCPHLRFEQWRRSPPPVRLFPNVFGPRLAARTCFCSTCMCCWYLSGVTYS